MPAAPPDRPVFFTDRDLGARVVPAALRAADFEVVVMQDHYGPDVSQRLQDHEWIPDIAGIGLVILTNDTAMRFNPLIVRAIRAAGARCFALARQNLSGAEGARRFVIHRDTIMRRATDPGPYFIHVHADRIEPMPLSVDS